MNVASRTPRRRAAAAAAGAAGLTILVAAWGPPVSAAATGFSSAHDLAPPQDAAHPPNHNEDCMECHAPHHAQPHRALWNREISGVTYQLYGSSTLQSTPSQPTGVSRLCLGCHDGTIALNAPRAGRIARARAGRPLTGVVSVGADLSDDHPISIEYSPELAIHREGLQDPALLPKHMRLENGRILQCTTCHDPHARNAKNFLVTDNRFSQLCITCHRVPDWEMSIHAVATARWDGRGANPWPHSEYQTTAENGCASCHGTHGANARWLLNDDAEEGLCLKCHAGTVAAKNIAPDLQKRSTHPVTLARGVHEGSEDPSTMKRHVECSDCHAPHRTRATGTVQSGMPAALFGAAGVDVSGNVVQPAGFEYEVCFRCHGIDEQQTPIVLRADPPANARREFDVQNTSYHPVVAPGKSAQVPGLIGGQAETGTIRCIDCHSSDSAAGSAGARGPHGSVYRPILEREYAMADPGLESTDSYALCYKCHSREILLGARSRFPHREHVVGANAACAVCHDAHGSRRLPHLVNFMLQDELGNPVVRPAANGRLEYESLGIGRASCSLSCHGVDHAPKAYAR